MRPTAKVTIIDLTAYRWGID